METLHFLLHQESPSSKSSSLRKMMMMMMIIKPNGARIKVLGALVRVFREKEERKWLLEWERRVRKWENFSPKMIKKIEFSNLPRPARAACFPCTWGCPLSHVRHWSPHVLLAPALPLRTCFLSRMQLEETPSSRTCGLASRTCGPNPTRATLGPHTCGPAQEPRKSSTSPPSNSDLTPVPLETRNFNTE